MIAVIFAVKPTPQHTQYRIRVAAVARDYGPTSSHVQ